MTTGELSLKNFEGEEYQSILVLLTFMSLDEMAWFLNDSVLPESNSD